MMRSERTKTNMLRVEKEKMQIALAWPYVFHACIAFFADDLTNMYSKSHNNSFRRTHCRGRQHQRHYIPSRFRDVARQKSYDVIDKIIYCKYV
ncbi:Uncharacterized protein TCM_025148 [Theobroma cacao]|nr:Uncharacterized protein TCM_025148 [Theobroma cacao]